MEYFSKTPSLGRVIEKYNSSSSTRKFNCSEEAVLEAIDSIREQEQTSKAWFELFLQLQDKKNGRKATLVDFTVASNKPTVRFSENLKNANAAATIDALMMLGSKLDEAADQVSKETGVATDTIKRWCKSHNSESKNKWAYSYHRKVSTIKSLNKNELRGLCSIFIKVCQ